MNERKRRLGGAISGSLAIALLAAACTNQGTACDDLTIEDAFVRLPPGMNTAIYLTITNTGSEDTALIGASTDIVSLAELHEVVPADDGMMKMQAIEGQRIEIPAGESVELKPGGLHIMGLSLRTDLTEGQEVALTLNFDDDCSIDLTAPVKALEQPMEGTGMGASNGMGGGHEMGHGNESHSGMSGGGDG